MVFKLAISRLLSSASIAIVERLFTLLGAAGVKGPTKTGDMCVRLHGWKVLHGDFLIDLHLEAYMAPSDFIVGMGS